jgi:hypothetical protein
MQMNWDHRLRNAAVAKSIHQHVSAAKQQCVDFSRPMMLATDCSWYFTFSQGGQYQHGNWTVRESEDWTR